jgi:hypothetical protein
VLFRRHRMSEEQGLFVLPEGFVKRLMRLQIKVVAKVYWNKLDEVSCCASWLAA